MSEWECNDFDKRSNIINCSLSYMNIRKIYGMRRGLSDNFELCMYCNSATSIMYDPLMLSD